jgi:glycosyltransferase involved in cell wall biosynthesis
MKLYVGMIAYNEEVFIDAAIRSVYDRADRIFVMDGSPWGASTDRTAEIARRIGVKVQVISGTFRNEAGQTDHKVIQRRAYLSLMPRDINSWCVLQDADEMWSEENIKRLSSHMKSLPQTCLALAYNCIHFWRDDKHIITGGAWSRPREISAWRLCGGMTHITHNRVGIPGVSEWTHALSPTRMYLNDVTFHHYGHAVSKEKKFWKLRYYVERGDFRKTGYGVTEWERFCREKAEPEWAKVFNVSGVVSYTGEHPETIEPIRQKLWGIGGALEAK